MILKRIFKHRSNADLQRILHVRRKNFVYRFQRHVGIVGFTGQRMVLVPVKNEIRSPHLFCGDDASFQLLVEYLQRFMRVKIIRRVYLIDFHPELVRRFRRGIHFFIPSLFCKVRKIRNRPKSRFTADT